MMTRISLAGGSPRTSSPQTFNLLLLPRILRMSESLECMYEHHPEVESCFELGRVLVLDDPPAGCVCGVRQAVAVRGRGRRAAAARHLDEQERIRVRNAYAAGA